MILSASDPAPLPDRRWIHDGLLGARSQWPSVAVADDVVAAHIEEKWHAAAFSKLRFAELFIACACARRDAAAIALFEKAYFEEIDGVVRRFPSLPVTVDDVRQRIRESMYLRDPPALLGYDGRGSLRHWFRAAVLHAVLNIASREKRENPTDAEFFDAIVDPNATADEVYLKIACKDRIEAVFRVHRATAARWIAKARQHLVDQTYAELATRLALAPNDVSSIVRAALTGLGTTLLRSISAPP